jgi:hypothetical protein
MNAAAATRSDSLLLGGSALAWAGFLAGVSLLATPIKFTAPSLVLPVALDVGRVTFAALNRVEIGAALIFLVLAVWVGRTLWNVAGAALLAGLVAAQTLWLLPGLDARVDTIIAGGTPPESNLHLVYVLVEGIKLLILFALAILNLWGVQRGRSSGSSSS